METTTLPKKYDDPMADRLADEISDYPAFFQSKVLINVDYWNDYVKIHQADIAALKRERERIITALDFGLNLDQAWPAAYELITTFASFIERQGQWEIWQRVLEQAIKTAEQLGDRVGMTTLYAFLARLEQRQSHPKQTVYYYRRAIKLARVTGNRFEEARACSNLGYLFIEQGRWPRAEVLCCHALALFEQIDNDHGRAHTHNHLGVLYTRQRRWPQAQQHLGQACAIWETMGDNLGLMYGFINLGLLCNDIERPNKSIHYLDKALQLAKLTEDEVLVGTIYMNMGISYRLRGVPTQAEAFARQAEVIFRRFSNLLGLAEVWHNLGLACMDQEKWEEAWQYLAAALQGWRNLNYEYGEIRTLVYMLEYEIARGRQSQAMEQLNELEQRNHQTQWGRRYPYLEELLEKCRHSLIGGSS